MGKRVTRRSFLRTSFVAAAGCAVPLAGYAQFVEPHRLTVEKLELPIRGLPDVFDGFRIAQLSDFHYGEYAGDREVSTAVAAANALQPDLIAVTGDFITSPPKGRRAPLTDPAYTYIVSCARLLAGLKSNSGTFGCFGNHDANFNERYVSEVFASFGMKLLVNDNHPIERQGKRLWVAGVADAIMGQPDYDRALHGVAGEPVVLLAHEPDVADETAKHAIAVQLSGHSHGGQVRLPLLGCPCLPRLAQKYPYGHYRIGDLHLYTNRGIGTILLPYRFNAPPEVTLITLRTMQ